MSSRHTCQYCAKKRYSDVMVMINSKSDKNGKPEWACKACLPGTVEIPFEDVPEPEQTEPVISEPVDNPPAAPEPKPKSRPAAKPKDKTGPAIAAEQKPKDKSTGSVGFNRVIEEHLQQLADKDPLFAVTFAKENKNINDCATYILNQVKKSGRQAFTDEEIFGMAVHFYDEDDLKAGTPASATVVHTTTTK